MAGISDKAIKSYYAENKYRYNSGAELQNKEFSDGTGLELYETTFRGYDPQLGRFKQIDPLADRFNEISVYQFGLNNPIAFNDPTGALTKAEFDAALGEASKLLNSDDFVNGPGQNVSLVSGGHLAGQMQGADAGPADGGDNGGAGGGGNYGGTAFTPSDLTGYSPIWAVDPINGLEVVGWAKDLATATVTAKKKENAVDVAAKTIDYTDQAMTLTDANLVGAQKLANVVSKTSNKITFLKDVAVLGAVARVTGVATIVVDGAEAVQAAKEGKVVKAIWKGAEAV